MAAMIVTETPSDATWTTTSFLAVSPQHGDGQALGHVGPEPGGPPGSCGRTFVEPPHQQLLGLAAVRAVKDAPQLGTGHPRTKGCSAREPAVSHQVKLAALPRPL
jgi:hypothetical protein